MAEWSNLWGHTHDECLALLTDGKAYFTILVSQVTQRLVKAIKQVDFDKMTFLVNFIDEMGKDTNMAKLDGDYTSEAYHCIKTILDPNAVPSRVNTACEAFGKGHELRNHWLITAFSLEKGKEVVDLALQRAKKREEQSGVLEKIAEADANLEEMGILNHNHGLVREELQEAFSADYAQILVDAHQVCRDPGLSLIL